MSVCTQEGCHEPEHVRGRCRRHYYELISRQNRALWKELYGEEADGPTV